MSVVCSAVSVALPTVGTDLTGKRLWSHIESCDECEAQYRRYVEMYNGLATLRDTPIAPPAGLPQRVMASLGPVAVPDLEERWEHAVPVAAAAALATAAAGTAVLFKIYRHRAA
ncbi:MAG: hypothetical protein ABFR53_04050 [Actinomycetota bacterium]